VGYKLVMPKDIGVDWKLVEAEYMRGTRVVDIATFYKLSKGTLDARIRRGGWAPKRLALRDALTVKETGKTMQTFSNRASAYLESVVKEVDKGMSVLSASVPGTAKEVDQHFEALGKIDRVARPALGLSDQGNGGKGSLINIAVLQQFTETPSVKNCQDI
jgi:hypothetical protein